MTNLSRRGLLGTIICAPAIVRASSLMPIKPDRFVWSGMDIGNGDITAWNPVPKVRWLNSEEFRIILKDPAKFYTYTVGRT